MPAVLSAEQLYRRIEAQLKESEALISPSELHGHLCGRYVVGHPVEGGFGVRMIADYAGLSPGELKTVAESLTGFIKHWILVMDRELFSFRLFLPDDNTALVGRLAELARWSEGFLSGLASTSGDGEAKIMQEEREILADLVEISKMDSAIEDNDENEALYAEVSEYVRLAVFSLVDRFRELAVQVAREERQADQPGQDAFD